MPLGSSRDSDCFGGVMAESLLDAFSSKLVSFVFFVALSFLEIQQIPSLPLFSSLLWTSFELLSLLSLSAPLSSEVLKPVLGPVLCCDEFALFPLLLSRALFSQLEDEASWFMISIGFSGQPSAPSRELSSTTLASPSEPLYSFTLGLPEDVALWDGRGAWASLAD